MLNNGVGIRLLAAIQDRYAGYYEVRPGNFIRCEISLENKPLKPLDETVRPYRVTVLRDAYLPP